MQATDEKPKMVNLTINGKAVQVPAGTNVIDAAEKVGVYIPRYCYHPDLSIAGVCRMCMCEVEKNPKLQISCNMVATEGMVVNTETPRVKDAVKSTLELHLINHPLDCPICDKAGECKLQDFYSDFGLYESRMDFDAKVHKPKVQDIGTIVLDSERCILCSRCVRFTAEVTKTHEFGIFNRGDRATLQTYDQGPLRNDYTGNLADICPVGALTAKDFRFAQRVWFLDKTSSVCTMCARGCNTQVSVNQSTRKLYRVEPRRNPEVNKSWICDTGRWGYHHVYDAKRVRVPRELGDGVRGDRTWEQAFKTIHAGITANPARVLVALSTQLTNEEIVDSVKTLKAMGVKNFTWVVDEKVVDEKTPYDEILKHADLTPNAAGFKAIMTALGEKWMKKPEAIAALGKKSYDWVIVLGLEGHDLKWSADLLAAVPREASLVVHTTSDLPLFEGAKWLLPNVSSFEKSGTVVNALGRVQKVNASLPPQHTARDAHGVAFGLQRGNDREALPLKTAQEHFETAIHKLLPTPTVKWKGFQPMGVSLERGEEHAHS